MPHTHTKGSQPQWPVPKKGLCLQKTRLSESISSSKNFEKEHVVLHDTITLSALSEEGRGGGGVGVER